MSDIKFMVVRGVVDSTKTATQTFDITHASETWTPTAARIICNRATADETDTLNAYCGSIGHLVGSTNHCLAFASEAANATMDAMTHLHTDAVIDIRSTSNQTTVEGEATAAFISGGLRFTVTTQFTGNFKVTLELFGGADLSVALNIPTLDASEIVTHSLSDNNQLHFFLTSKSNNTDQDSNDLMANVGTLAVSGGDTVVGQWCAMHHVNDTTSSATCVLILFDDNAAAHSATSTNEDCWAAGSISTTAFTMTRSAGSRHKPCSIMSLGTADSRCHADLDESHPTSGDMSVTTGWTPVALGLFSTRAPTSTSIGTNGTVFDAVPGAENFCISAYDGTDQGAMLFVHNDAEGTSELLNFSGAGAVYAYDVDYNGGTRVDTVKADHDYAAFSATGATFTENTYDDAARHVAIWAIEDTSSAGITDSITESHAELESFVALAGASSVLAAGDGEGEGQSPQASAGGGLIEGAGHGESVTAMAAAVAVVTEGHAVAEAMSAMVSAMSSITEGSGFGDDASAGVSDSMSAGFGASDLWQAVVAAGGLLSDSAEFGEAASAMANAGGVLSEGAGHGDESSVGGQAFTDSMSESHRAGALFTGQVNVPGVLTAGQMAGEIVNALAGAVASAEIGAGQTAQFEAQVTALGVYEDAHGAGEAFAVTAVTPTGTVVVGTIVIRPIVGASPVSGPVVGGNTDIN